MTWFWIALAAPMLWGAVNHMDKYIISKYFSGKGVGALVIFTSLSGCIASIFILIFNYHSIELRMGDAVLIACNGALLVASFIPYLHALEEEDASLVTALYQLIPVFDYFLAFIFLKEHLSIIQILGSLLVVSGAIVISLDLSGKVRVKIKPLLLMVLSAFMIAVNALIFKIVALQANFWGTAFWEYVGGLILGVLLFSFIKLYRQQFITTIKKNKTLVLGLNLFSELLNIAAKLLANFASLLAPLALVWVVNGFQPAIVFIYGLLLTMFIPSVIKEKIERKVLIQRISAIILIFAGVYILLK